MIRKRLREERILGNHKCECKNKEVNTIENIPENINRKRNRQKKERKDKRHRRSVPGSLISNYQEFLREQIIQRRNNYQRNIRTSQN